MEFDVVGQFTGDKSEIIKFFLAVLAILVNSESASPLFESLSEKMSK